MRAFFDKIGRIFGWVDAAEFVIPALIAAFILVVGPLLAAVHLFRSQHTSAALVVAGFWVLVVLACVRDFRRRHVGWLSVTLGVIWIIATLVICWKLETV